MGSLQRALDVCLEAAREHQEDPTPETEARAIEARRGVEAFRDNPSASATLTIGPDGVGKTCNAKAWLKIIGGEPKRQGGPLIIHKDRGGKPDGTLARPRKLDLWPTLGWRAHLPLPPKPPAPVPSPPRATSVGASVTLKGEQEPHGTIIEFRDSDPDAHPRPPRAKVRWPTTEIWHKVDELDVVQT